MSYLESYQNRLKRNGSHNGEAYTNNTIAMIQSTFHASPTFRVLGVRSAQYPDLMQMDARIIKIERLGSLREVIFRPNQRLEIGTYITFDDDTWIIFDQFRGLVSKVIVAKCNHTLRWKNQHDQILEFDCVASTMDLGSKTKKSKDEIRWNKYDVPLPMGQLLVFVESNSATSQIELNHRFIFNRKAYEVVGIDGTTLVNKSGFGVLQLTLSLTTLQEGDDLTNRIASNRYPLEESPTREGLW
ncbi:hypothetical protein [Thermoactinomyces sp. DSM 45892]|uniref:hypothetical protein n=1 Tax=Thermoactinomyces sp. DSM 45892 TaxID=1882753 RepID=UPI000897DAF8|nr:hypothetical protein [Thermoactinomyces sp. DSM 45892]SDX95546.1 hypothetical protein SAMN05444416_10196 [Thermoactinomyces sp. DSM 45892]